MKEPTYESLRGMDGEALRRLADTAVAVLAEKKAVVRRAEDLYGVLAKYQKKRQEMFIVLSLDGNHSIIRERKVTTGTVNRTIAHPREVFRGAVMDNAVAVIIAHNHPSGSVEPSMEDKELTTKMVKAGEVMGIPVLDHLIVGDGFYSFLARGLM